jgi:hypothetical protein
MAKINQEQLKALCDVIAETNAGLTKSELTLVLGQSGITAVDDRKMNNGFTYTIGLSKRNWLYNCLVNQINQSKSLEKVYALID